MGLTILRIVRPTLRRIAAIPPQGIPTPSLGLVLEQRGKSKSETRD
jgi:hypothetical protein